VRLWLWDGSLHGFQLREFDEAIKKKEKEGKRGFGRLRKKGKGQWIKPATATAAGGTSGNGRQVFYLKPGLILLREICRRRSSERDRKERL